MVKKYNPKKDEQITVCPAYSEMPDISDYYKVFGFCKLNKTRVCFGILDMHNECPYSEGFYDEIVKKMEKKDLI